MIFPFNRLQIDASVGSHRVVSGRRLVSGAIALPAVHARIGGSNAQ